MLPEPVPLPRYRIMEVVRALPACPPEPPCALQFRTTPPNTNREYQWSARVDHVFNNNDRGYIRVLRDNGFQPSYTSPFGPMFQCAK